MSHPSGGYVWYRFARLLRFPTRHLATDHFLTRDELAALLRNAGFSDIRIDSWTFIPRGDMPRWAAALLSVMDVLRVRSWRGGLRFVGTR